MKNLGYATLAGSLIFASMVASIAFTYLCVCNIYPLCWLTCAIELVDLNLALRSAWDAGQVDILMAICWGVCS